MNKDWVKVFWFAVTMFVLLWIATLSAVAHADPDDNCTGNPHHCNGGDGGVDVTTDVVTDVTTNVGGTDVDIGGTSVSHSNRSLALGNGLGDVDINDCRESVQFGTPLFSKQNVRLNPWCAAEVYDAKGMYQMAAVMRCDIKDVRKHFTSDDECIKANTYEAVAPMAPPPVVIIDKSDDEEEEAHDNFEARLKAIEQKREQDLERSRKIAAEQRKLKEEQKMRAQQSLEALQQYRKPENE